MEQKTVKPDLDRLFTFKDYDKGSLIREQRRLIKRVLVKTNGCITEAHKILCPGPNPSHSLRTLNRLVHRHQINIEEIKNNVKIESVQW